MSNQNVYRYDSPVIYSSEELEIIKELVGFIRQYKGIYQNRAVKPRPLGRGYKALHFVL